MRATRAIIHLDRLRNNLGCALRLLDDEQAICVAVKANAYGHGLVAVACELCKHPEAARLCLGVATVSEGAELREAGIPLPIWLFSYADSSELPLLYKYQLQPFVGDAEYCRAVADAGRDGSLAVHVKIDSGMGRIGCTIEGLAPILRVIEDAPHARVAAICTHLADAYDARYTEEQYAYFDRACAMVWGAPGGAALRDAPGGAMSDSMVPGGAASSEAAPDSVVPGGAASSGTAMQDAPGSAAFVGSALRDAPSGAASGSMMPGGMVPGGVASGSVAMPRHAANSGAILSGGGRRYEAVRPGIMIYGYDSDPASSRYDFLQPVMELRSKIVALKYVRRGTAISYGMTWRAPRDTQIATIPIGYGDGYTRRLSNRDAKVLVQLADDRLEEAPIVGRICMDQLMIDVGRLRGVALGQDVILFGDKEGRIGADKLARQSDTIAYEITTAIQERVPRQYVDAEQNP